MVISWSKSECKDSYLHDYQLIWQDQGAVVEICKICRDKQVFKIVNGRINNIQYLQYHLKQALPVFHRLYKRQHGNKK